MRTDIRSATSPLALGAPFPRPSLGDAMEEVSLSVDRFCLLAGVICNGEPQKRGELPEEWISRAQRRLVSSPLKKAPLTGFHSMAKHIAAKAVSPSSETMRTT